MGENSFATVSRRFGESFPFEIISTVLLPDHWHLVMQLPPGDSDCSIRIKRIKTEFTRQWLGSGLAEVAVAESRQSKGERGVWQPRFWEHTIQDEDDLQQCCDYIHWNPIKHELVDRTQDWPWSSFHRFVMAGQYEINWGGTVPKCMTVSRDWGE